MPNPARRAARPALALIAALGAITTASPAFGQADPFELPAGLTAQSVKPDDGPRLVEIVVNGQAKARMVTVAGSGRELAIEAGDARAAGLPLPEGASGPVKLSAVRLYDWKFDALRQRLTVELYRTGADASVRDFAAQAERASESTPLLAMRLDYDLTATVTRSGSSAAGLVAASVVYGNFAIDSAARISTSPPIGSPGILRLDTTAHLALPALGAGAKLGDFVSAGSQSQRAVRMGGIQFASDFALRPDLVVMPLPGFAGQVAVPTTLDVMSGDQRFTLGEVAPGDFSVRNIPSQPGRGEASVILRDALGRETVQTARFYVSNLLLAPGRTGYAVNAGFVRRRYGLRSNDYGPFAATAYLRRGLSPVLTAEVSGEWTNGVANAGARADFVLAKVALATVEARVSHDARAGTGTLLTLGLESTGRKLGAAVRATLPSASYRDIASRFGDDPPPREVAAQLSYRLGAQTEFQLSYARQDYRSALTGQRTRYSEVFGASGRVRLSPRANVFFGGSAIRNGGGTAYSAAVGLSLNLGERTNAGAYASYDSGRFSGGANYARSAQRDGDIGYNASATVSETSQRVAGGATYRHRALFLDAQVEQVNGVFAGRASARGTLLLAGGTVFARNQSGGSYALVRTGRVGGIPITRENQEVGVTNASGRLLVQDIPAQATIKIDVKADKLPPDALVRETTKLIRVPYRGVALVDIETLRFRPVMRRLVTEAGAPLDAGLPARSLPSGEMTITGYDGMAEINAGSPDTALVVGRPGNLCTVSLSAAALDGVEGPPLVCRPIADFAAAEPARPGKPRKGKRPAAVALSAP